MDFHKTLFLEVSQVFHEISNKCWFLICLDFLTNFEYVIQQHGSFSKSFDQISHNEIMDKADAQGEERFVSHRLLSNSTVDVVFFLLNPPALATLMVYM